MPPPTRQRFTSTPTEADTCRTYVVPKLQTAGWDTEPHSIVEQRQFTAGRIVVAGTKATRQKAKKADYLLRYTPEMTLARREAPEGPGRLPIGRQTIRTGDQLSRGARTLPEVLGSLCTIPGNQQAGQRVAGSRQGRRCLGPANVGLRGRVLSNRFCGDG